MNLATTRVLTDDDLKKIRYLKMRRAIKRVDRKGFASSDEEDEKKAVIDGEASGEEDS